MARRLLIDDIRRRELERAYVDACAHETLVDPLTPERITTAIQLLDGVLRLLAGLPEQATRAFLLRRLEGLSHGQIAQALRVSERTVKRHIASAYAHCYALAYPTGGRDRHHGAHRRDCCPDRQLGCSTRLQPSHGPPAAGL